MISLNINTNTKKPLYLQIADEVINNIKLGNYRKGDRISSITELSDEHMIARETVQKAYNYLREKGIVDAVHGKGFFIEDVSVKFQYRVLMLLTRISNYKKQIYQSFVETLGSDAIVDLKIHNCNSRLFAEQIENNLKQYNRFVVMPHFHDEPELALDAMRTIPEKQLFIIDNKPAAAGIGGAAVYQDFENDIRVAMEQSLDLLAKYQKLILVFPAVMSHDPGIILGFRKFCMQNDYRFGVVPEISADFDVQPGQAYVVIEEEDLANLIRSISAKKYSIGKEVGIISYNDSPLKDLLMGGISVITTDHRKMGETAARLLLENRMEIIANPFMFIRRNSL